MSAKLYAPDLPDPDLIIRTSGEQRLSGSCPGKAPTVNLMFHDALWPDFTPAMLPTVWRRIATRERRFGLLSGKCSSLTVLQNRLVVGLAYGLFRRCPSAGPLWVLLADDWPCVGRCGACLSWQPLHRNVVCLAWLLIVLPSIGICVGSILGQR